ncbi:hypothetical protein M0802_012934 [Mischocyttarus mexicanus]|nr:hypothetical protein M0802_012934 [Mischocyttarus mexicanus]
MRKSLNVVVQQRHPPLILGWMFLVLPFLPASNLFLTVGFVVAERVLYMPSVGWTLLVVYGIQVTWTAVPRRRSFITVGVVLLLILGCYRTFLRNNDWTSRETLLRLWPTYASAHNNLGTLTVGDQAEQHFLAAIHAQPGHVNAHYNLGQLYRSVMVNVKRKRMQLSIVTPAGCHSGPLGRFLRSVKSITAWRKTIIRWNKCVSLDPAYIPAYLVLARLASGPATGVLLRHVVRLQPRSPDHLAEYATWLYQNGKWLPSLKYYLKGMEVSPSHRSSLVGTARILRSRGQWPRVHQLITRWHLMLRAKRGGLIYRGDLYIRAWQLQSESRQRAHQHQRNLCLSEENCSTPRVASVSMQLEQDSNKSEQLERAPRCTVRTCRQTRKGKARVTAPALLVQNLLETL